MSRLVTGTVRFSYLNVFEKGTLDDKYSVVLLIPKSDTKTINAVKKAIYDAIDEGVDKKWHGKRPANLWNPLQDGDEEKADEHPEYANMMYIRAKSSRQPILLDEYKNEILDQTELYSGCWGRANITFFPFDNNMKGIAVGLNALQKKRDDEAFGGALSKQAAIDSFGDDDDDLLL